MKRIALLAMLALPLITACGNKSEKENRDNEKTADNEILVRIQPYNTVTNEEAEHLIASLKPQMATLTEKTIRYEIMPAQELSDTLKTEGKYRALDILKNEIKSRNEAVIIGYTHDDIATKAHGIENWGIFGLAYKGLNVAVISDKRLKDKENIWKVAEHEFIHAYFDYDHCPFNEPHCIMQDAKGKNPLRQETDVCDSCRKRLIRNN